MDVAVIVVSLHAVFIVAVSGVAVGLTGVVFVVAFDFECVKYPNEMLAPF